MVATSASSLTGAQIRYRSKLIQEIHNLCQRRLSFIQFYITCFLPWLLNHTIFFKSNLKACNYNRLWCTNDMYGVVVFVPDFTTFFFLSFLWWNTQVISKQGIINNKNCTRVIFWGLINFFPLSFWLKSCNFGSLWRAKIIFMLNYKKATPLTKQRAPTPVKATN